MSRREVTLGDWVRWRRAVVEERAESKSEEGET
jgi:hypothetical protein